MRITLPPDAVVDCWWIKGKLDCYSQHGVEYNKAVGKSLTITLKQVTSAHTGKYACQVSGYESSSLEICELHLKLGTENTCRITYDKSVSRARLDCFLNKDIAEARKSFAVYKTHGQDKQAVLAECLWENNQPKCQVASGYQLQDAVSSYLTLWIQEVTKEKAGNYSCLPAGSLITQQNTCVLSVSEEDENITCSVPIVKPLQDTVLTCNFPEDLNVTKKDFSVYHYNNGVNSDAVLDCWWFDGTLKCIQSPSVQYNRIVSKTLSLTIRRVTTNNTGTYACQVAGHHPTYFKTCDLQVKIGKFLSDRFLNRKLTTHMHFPLLKMVKFS
ncbi:uncharacterized protein LOC112575685 [Pomacea canaliculata]|uniref:uncharacterized protein LOC112575685 n=1 Tax=Pomacea canaliculata TaxID=400727 RepID=UPI000D733C38|nr:uncharacterized protein LOC112575685 [Pomacea canaliculata]